MDTPIRCSVVIPHLQGEAPLLACLRALHEQPAAGGVEIVLVDNASSDGSVDRARTAWPGIRIVRSERNLGYAGGCNLGLEAARGRWTVFLNDDARMAPGALEVLLGDLERGSPDRLVQPTLRSAAAPERFDYAGGAGGLIDRWGYPFALGRLFHYLEQDEEQYRMRGPLAWASGCCLAGPTELFRRLGGFEESFFAHFEEIDLAWRHRRGGGRIEGVPEAVVFHLGPATLPEGARKTYLNFRNSLWTLRRNLAGARLAGVLAGRVLLDGAALGRLLLMGRLAEAAAVGQGWWHGLTRKPWGPVVPPRGRRTPSAEEGTYRGSVALAVWLGGVRRASQLLPRVRGWERFR
jgi:GT2 family glycosyltransferase